MSPLGAISPILIWHAFCNHLTQFDPREEKAEILACLHEVAGFIFTGQLKGRLVPCHKWIAPLNKKYFRVMLQRECKNALKYKEEEGGKAAELFRIYNLHVLVYCYRGDNDHVQSKVT